MINQNNVDQDDIKLLEAMANKYHSRKQLAISTLLYGLVVLFRDESVEDLFDEVIKKINTSVHKAYKKYQDSIDKD